MAKTRILLADDHAEMRERIREHLNGEFEVVAAVGNGQEALDAARRLRPDVAILDIFMPVLDGIETANQLLEADPNLRVIFLTSLSGDEVTKKAAMETGAHGYVAKIRMITELVPAIKLALAEKSGIPKRSE
jgi:DNA-binding NarL/FixJ family response regulator